MKKSLVSTTVAFLAVIPFAAGAASAWDSSRMGGYIGGGVGYAQIEGEEIFDDGDINFEDDRTTWQLYGGFKFAPYFGLEANYVDFDEATDTGVVFATDGFGLAIAGHLPVTDYFTLSARVGQFWWDADLSVDDFDIAFSDSGNDTFYGVDARFGRPDGGLGFAIKYDRYDIGNTDINMPSVNVEFGF